MPIKHILKQAILYTLIPISTSMCSQVNTRFPEPDMQAFPVLSITNDTVDIDISSMQINLKVTGNIALTSYDITFFNPSDKTLEGELSFPLKSNQHIVGFSMDIEGKLRKGVVVEKEKGRQVFESIVREGIDPGLLEKTSGNNFRARVFPILSKHTKRIVITCREELALSNNSCVYQLPMQFSKPVAQFSIRIEVTKGFKKPVIAQNDFTHLQFEKWQEAFVAEAHNQTVYPNGLLAIELPYDRKKNAVFCSESDGECFFYTSMPLNITAKKKAKPEHIHILWDISGSGLNRDTVEEIKMLNAYFRFLGDAKVSLSTFNYKINTVGDFMLEDGRADKLFEAIGRLRYDGGSRMDNILFNDFEGREIIMVSDGLANLGELKTQTSSVPIMVINSSLKANHQLLHHLASSNGGVYIDLSVSGADANINKMIEQPISVRHTVTDGLIKDEVVELSASANQLIITGKLPGSKAELNVEIRRGNELVHRRLIKISTAELNPHLPVARLWATQKINQLMIDKKRNKNAIITLAKQYGVVTDYTSLMVLERVEDYVRFQIEPPLELKEKYDGLMRAYKKNKDKQLKNNRDDLHHLIEDYKQWWNTNFPLHKNVSRKEECYEEIEYDDTPSIEGTVVVTQQEENCPPPPLSAGTDVLFMVENDMELEEEACYASGRQRSRQNISTAINATPWDSTASYMAFVFKLDKEEVYDYYLNIKSRYPHQPSFYLDIASYLFDIAKTEQGISVISNIAELQLENAEIMRIAGQKLLQQKQWKLAVQVFRRVVEMRPEELQSYRNLALAYEKGGFKQKALDVMISTLNMNDLRDNKGLKGIILNEINCLINRNGELVNKAALNKAWRYNMPVDIRIVLSWSTDNSDVDLWISEPSGEKCFYSYKRTRTGGRLSQDITNGYGPEEYMMKAAKKGSYKIQANYYGDQRASISGPITLRAEIFQNYGTSKQTSRQLVLQLKDKKQVIDLGEVIVD